ncbi:hypothetical protein COT99_00015 [Candidatus Falkowbacteria bacterium CG10_big_fil_rev_8_21_14_0_10_43_10]|uniref:Acyltransferase n=1 Tax=Candidatus Falkowbacteria bacterium CG10_big_fil_rev_8_21_14_0_10_43_10 TaxID=1974567 RepID=A0A2H0V371_9BACT|nr:MAG: hypothetical protein COT99_00015 [Candidatus Falkowbacteria bacterium CG10_big_fil_rev_8_21_14_0_10_43_10]
MNLNSLFKQINVRRGENCEVSDFCSLENVTLGNNVRIGDFVQLKNVLIGDGTKVGVNVRFYSPDPARPVKIGRECWLSYGVFGEATGGEIIIEDYAVIAHRSVLLTSSGPGEKNSVMDAIYPRQQGSIHIGKYSWAGAQCTILLNAFLEEGVVLGAHTFAAGDRYRAWTVYGGSPAKILKNIDPARVDRAKKMYG